MIEKNRGNEVILEMVEALKNKNFEFPRADYKYKRENKKLFPAGISKKIRRIDFIPILLLLNLARRTCAPLFYHCQVSYPAFRPLRRADHGRSVPIPVSTGRIVRRNHFHRRHKDRSMRQQVYLCMEESGQ